MPENVVTLPSRWVRVTLTLKHFDFAIHKKCLLVNFSLPKLKKTIPSVTADLHKTRRGYKIISKNVDIDIESTGGPVVYEWRQLITVAALCGSWLPAKMTQSNS